MPSSVVVVARKAGIPVTICESLDDVLADTDVLYVTRVQKERFASEMEWLQVKDAYRVDHAVLSRAKEDMIVMHPLPRVNGMSLSSVSDSFFPNLVFQKSILKSIMILVVQYTSARCVMVFSWVLYSIPFEPI